jgi:hypothetical protein
MGSTLEERLHDELKRTPLVANVRRRSAVEIEHLARRRQHRTRTTVVSTVAGVAMVGTVSVVQQSDDGGSADRAPSSIRLTSPHRASPTTRPGGGVGAAPACMDPLMKVLSADGALSVTGPSDGDLQGWIVNVAAGSTVTIRSQAQPNENIYVNSLQTVIATPGTQSGVPDGPAEDPANQLATSETIGGFVSAGQTLDVTWTPTEPGSYPLFAVETYSQQADCFGPPPTGDPMSEDENPFAIINVR